MRTSVHDDALVLLQTRTLTFLRQYPVFSKFDDSIVIDVEIWSVKAGKVTCIDNDPLASDR